MTSAIRKGSLLLLVASAAVLALPACRPKDISGPAPGTVFVSARDSFFQPETVTVMPGKSVRWTNQGALQHTVVADSAPWQSGLLPPTWWFEVRFDSVGVFGYHCSQHTGMTGTVIVQ
jgi:plastocyanin